MQASVFCQRGKNVHMTKSFNSGIALVLAKVRSSKVRPAKVGVRPGEPKDWVWIRPTIQSSWMEFLSLLFSTSKLGGNLAIVQSFEEAGGGDGVHTVLTYRWEWRQRILRHPGEALKSSWLETEAAWSSSWCRKGQQCSVSINTEWKEKKLENFKWLKRLKVD